MVKISFKSVDPHGFYYFSHFVAFFRSFEVILSQETVRFSNFKEIWNEQAIARLTTCLGSLKKVCRTSFGKTRMAMALPSDTTLLYRKLENVKNPILEFSFAIRKINVLCRYLWTTRYAAEKHFLMIIIIDSHIECD